MLAEIPDKGQAERLVKYADAPDEFGGKYPWPSVARSDKGGTFAAQKWGHNLTRVLRRGLEAAEDHCLLSATALNLKRMIKYMG